jgi:hypothetical protein
MLKHRGSVRGAFSKKHSKTVFPWVTIPFIWQDRVSECTALQHPPSSHSEVVQPERPASFPQFAVHTKRSGLADSCDGGNMSVAFAAPRQRGKGEITPAAIQKVKPGWVRDARPVPPVRESLGGRAGRSQSVCWPAGAGGGGGGGGGPAGKPPSVGTEPRGCG